jgi:hypothetical protein
MTINMAIGIVARIAGRATVTAGRYAVKLARSRGGKVIGGAMMAERATRPVRFGYGSSRVYSRMLDNRASDTRSQTRRRGASFEYVYKY